MLAGAGIKVWMLTGDKPETAESIARSCGLLPPGMAAVGLHALGPCEPADCQEALVNAWHALEQAPGLPPGHPAHIHQEAPQRGTRKEWGLQALGSGQAIPRLGSRRPGTRVTPAFGLCLTLLFGPRPGARGSLAALLCVTSQGPWDGGCVAKDRRRKCGTRA